MDSKELIAYASAFVSFVLPKIEVEEIILYGSVARKESSAESDIDLFFNVKKDIRREKINALMAKFLKSEVQKVWKNKGIKNAIRVESGNLEKWKLKRSIISDGMLLYGKYKEIPKESTPFMLFTISVIKDITKRNRIARWLFGRKENNYLVKGIVEEYGGKKLAPTSFIIPLAKAHEIIKKLSSEKVDSRFFEIWTDQIYESNKKI